MKKKAQNLIEFVMVMPLLIIIIFGIIEYSLFWKTSQTIQEMALKAAIGASTQYVDNTYTSSDMTDTLFNPAANQTVNIVQKNVGSLGLNNISFENPATITGTAPYAFYMFKSTKTTNTSAGTVPLMTLTVDYTDPYTSGVIVQLIYEYRAVFGGAEFRLPNGQNIVIIPKNIEISSTKIQQYINY